MCDLKDGKGLGKNIVAMLLLQGAQDVLQQSGDSGRQGPQSLRYLGAEDQALAVGKSSGVGDREVEIVGRDEKCEVAMRQEGNE
jgi:hypothetical protein